MKHIDTEKLKALIEEYENTAIEAYNPFEEDAVFWHGKVVACEDMKEFIDSLQQEQQEVEGWIARDKDGMLRMHGEKPRRSRDLWASPGASHDVSEFFSDDFIDWGDEPIEAKLVIRNARKEEQK